MPEILAVSHDLDRCRSASLVSDDKRLVAKKFSGFPSEFGKAFLQPFGYKGGQKLIDARTDDPGRV